MSPTAIDPRLRFWPKVDKTDTCWLWTGATDKDGYGRFYLNREKPSIPAFQLAWIWENGPIPEGLQPDHLCRNKACVRPSHLELVTGVTNNSRGHAKLTEQQVRDIREARARNEPRLALADLYGVSYMTIKYIETGKNYGWVV